MYKRSILAGAILAALGPCAATAETNEGFYVGLSGGLAVVDISRSDLDFVAVAGLQNVNDQINSVFANNVTSGQTFTSTLDDNDLAWGIQVGYRWNRYVAAELGYIDFGQAQYKMSTTISDVPNNIDPQPVDIRTRFVSTGPTLSILGMFPLGRFDLHARAGIYYSDTRVVQRVIDSPGGSGFLSAVETAAAANQTPITTSVQGKGTDKDLFFGVGGTWNISEGYSLRVEYQHFLDVGREEQTGERDIDLLTAGFLFR